MPGINIKKVDDYTYKIDTSQDERMLVPGIVYSSPEMIETIRQDQSLQQVVNVSMLPGIVKASMAMPDIHWGYGFPIGGVAAFDSEKGIISPGGVGYDINCGVSLVRTDLTYGEIKPRIREITDELFRKVPSGMGSTSTKVTDRDLDEILSGGLQWCLDNEFATREDLLHTEENGCMRDNSPNLISIEARKRGLKQIGTLGAGNHFLEVQSVDRILESDSAKAFGIKETGQVTIMIHTGSRGLGHQVATDFIRRLNSSEEGVVNHPVDRQLTSALLSSQVGMEYFQAMNSAANYGFVNRQVISNNVRSVFRKFFPDSEVNIVYSLAHNMAKRETHIVDGEKMDLMVHRKGATRAFSSDVENKDGTFSGGAHPVLIPGDMGTASYILKGKPENESRSFGSSCHGAGRRLSRKKSLDTFSTDEVTLKLQEKGVYLRAQNMRVISEEAPGSYKNIDDVIRSVTGAGLTDQVARLIPLGVVKG